LSDPTSYISRRELLLTSAAAGSLSVLGIGAARPEVDTDEAWPMIDTNISLFHWPFRRLPLDETDVLVKQLQSLGIAEAWAGSFEGLLHRDLAGVNERLAAACHRYPLLVPIGSINVVLPGWERDLEQCVGEHAMRGVRVHPNYHGYSLDHPRFARLIELATRAGRFVQVAAAMEDARTQHSLLQVGDVDLAPLADVVRRFPAARVQILNARPRGALLERLAGTPGVWFDTARVEGTSGVPQLVAQVGPHRVMLGSHAPFLIPQAALIRVHESGELQAPALRSVLCQTARAFAEAAG
jgi:predicted TIM-barrel fold metal-dependent hydrolase